MGRFLVWLVSSVLMAAGTRAGEKLPAFPLRVSETGRYLVDGEGKPFLINGDTPWSLIGQVSREDAELYLRDCASRRINSLIVTLVESIFADNAPANFYGVRPFRVAGKFTTPVEEYFEHADRVIRKAGDLGILIILAPNYLGYGWEGYREELEKQNTVEDARWFGEWVGKRYRDFPNLIYVWGNDTNPGGLREKIRAMAEGARSMDPNHLHTYHGERNFSSRDLWDPSERWLGINATYTEPPVHTQCLRDYHRKPAMPFFLFEGFYEGDFAGATARDTRRQAYTAILCGACGQHYGNNPIWHMNGHPEWQTEPWKGHLDDEGRGDLIHVAELFESRRWWNLVPDDRREPIVTGHGKSYLPAARDREGDTVMIYFPKRVRGTVEMGRIRGDRARAWWFDPRDGGVREAGEFPSRGRLPFEPPSDDDWLLVIDAADAGFSAPGKGVAFKKKKSQ